MAKEKTHHSEPALKAVTAQRAPYLYRLLRLLGRGPQLRETLTKRLRRDVRSFYRDLSVLRSAGIVVKLVKGRYRLDGDAEEVIARVPFPDPRLTLGEATLLAKGRSRAHRKLQEQIKRIVERA